MRACVPLLGEAQNLWFCTILSEISENHLCILQYLAPVAFKTQLYESFRVRSCRSWEYCKGGVEQHQLLDQTPHLWEGWKLLIPPCVRASVRACVPLLGEAQNLCFFTILSEISENHLCILQYLAPVALKTHHKIDTFFVECSKHTIK